MNLTGISNYAVLDKSAQARTKLLNEISKQRAIKKTIAREDEPRVAMSYFNDFLTSNIKYIAPTK